MATKVRDGGGGGLYLIRKGGSASWQLRYERHGSEHWTGLGPYHCVSLKEARERARRTRFQLLDGLDPIKQRKADRAKAALEAAKAMTFEAAAKEYNRQHSPKWKNAKAAAQFLSTLKAYVFPVIGRLAVADIDTGLVLRCLEPIWREKPETASRVRGRIENVLSWTTIRGFRTGDNCARWKGHLEHVLPARSQVQKVEHHRALPFAMLPAFMAQLKEREGVAARALEFTILTAARTGESIASTWSEFDLDNKIWVIPAERMKTGKEHKVPLSDRAIELLKSLPTERDNPFVFIGGRGAALSNMAMAGVLKRMDRNEITVHGMRSTFSDWAHERSAFPDFVIEMSMAHAISSKVVSAYRRGDLYAKRSRLMSDWASYCYSTPTDAKVISLREAV